MSEHASVGGETSQNLVKVVFELADRWHGHATETLWAKQVGEDRFALRSVPFYVRGVSFGDIVAARPKDDGRLVVSGVPAPRGHSTYRIWLQEGTGQEDFLRYWEPIERLGCTYERATDGLFAVDVPPEANVNATYELLEAGEANSVWKFEEGHCGHVPDEE